MGIKGIYGELGPGQRVSLAKLAADALKNDHKPFRLAIDIAIWQFQTQAARGGTNPAIRTLFYRLVRLLATSITPIFVFDGPNKPALKRNKRSGRGDGVATAQAKRLIRLFGFSYHDAPGEAEAECALLQKQGIVDAVLSEDVDTIMFGCTRTLRNWSAEGTTSKTPTHVSLYDVNDPAIANIGLGREGMVLVALMSGGDYLPDGIPGCGVKVACEAAQAGYGKSVCSLKTSDEAGLHAWRQSLMHELKTNEKGYFRTKHKALAIPEDFPNLEVLRFYTHPAVSQQAKLDAVRQKLERKREIQLEDLREFTRETFDWDFRIGAIKFIRVLGHALLVQKLLQGQEEGLHLIQRISGRRQHITTQGTSELRVSYIPQDVVPIDLSREVDEDVSYGRDGLALNSDNEFEAGSNAMDPAEEAKTISGKVFDVAKPELAWVLEDVVRQYASEAVKTWEESEAAKVSRRSPTKKASGGRSRKAVSVPAAGTLDGFVRTTKLQSTADKGVGKDLGESAGANRSQPPKSNILRIPRPIPSRQMSKPSSPLASSPERPTTSWTTGSSPRTPRQRGPAAQPEAILISSSPVAAPPSPLPPMSASPTAQSRLRPATKGRDDQSSPLHPVHPLSRESPKSKASHTRKQRAAATKKAEAAKKPQESRFKQLSMDMFATQSPRPLEPRSQPISPPTRAKPPGRRGDDECDVVDITAVDGETLSEGPGSPGKRRSQGDSRSPTTSAAHSPCRKKKLLVPHVSADGFFTEVEVDEAERDARMTRGVRAGVARYSDVALIDLTGGD
ncbi:flap structure-specific endonuclease [Drechmeria coniospora]|uniref:Flap structure-specific endonuclease n=1 Tax=Drechmeria coniospora TaxID=98403 RepID=A0A151GMS4_DRECN|nr:flap structure-specific endonuclease [Drechmeria coniospora]KYK58396.1 flap structure-specific endonuclease [Drechmeria coniospora]